MSRAQSPTDIPRLPINVARFVTAQEQGDAGDFIGHGAAVQGVQLADFGLGVARAGGGVHGRGHAGFGQAGADGVAANVGAGELVAGCLHEGDDGGFGGGVVGCEGVFFSG